MCSVLRGSGDLRVSVHLKDKRSKTGGPTFPIVAGLSTCTAKQLLEGRPAPRWATASSGQDSNIHLWICNFCFTAINPEEAKWLRSKRGFEIILSASKRSSDIDYLIFWYFLCRLPRMRENFTSWRNSKDFKRHGKQLLPREALHKQ